MKRIFGLFVLMGVLMIPSVGFAAGDQLGIYVAPKFVYGLTQIESIKEYWTNGADQGVQGHGSKTDNAFGGSLAIGYDFGKKFSVPIRTELEYAIFSGFEGKNTLTYVHGGTSKTEWEVFKQKFQLQTLFFNAYWDINTGTKLTPYVGAGIGMAFINSKWTASGYTVTAAPDPWSERSGSKMNANFAWNIGAGLGYDITDNWTIDVGYRFVGLGSVKTGSYGVPIDTAGRQDEIANTHLKTKNLYQHQFALGVRFTF